MAGVFGVCGRRQEREEDREGEDGAVSGVLQEVLRLKPRGPGRPARATMEARGDDVAKKAMSAEEERWGRRQEASVVANKQRACAPETQSLARDCLRYRGDDGKPSCEKGRVCES